MVRDVGLAEDLAQDALPAALEQWSESDIPDNPGAWLLATAKHRAIDLLTAFLPAHEIQQAYEEAVRQKYLWHELGDLNLIL